MAGIEPATKKLTVSSSSAELHAIVVDLAGFEPATNRLSVDHSTAELQVKPSTGFEPAIFALQEHCITIMLQGQFGDIYLQVGYKGFEPLTSPPQTERATKLR